MSEQVKYPILEGHLEFCTTEKQVQMVKLVIEGKPRTEVAKALGIQPTNVSKTLKEIYRRGIDQGYDPEHQLDAVLPETQRLRGVTNLYRFVNGERQLSAQYVMGRSPKEQLENIEKHLESFAQGLTANITPARPVKPKSGRKYCKATMPSIFIGDAHIGMRAFGQETKHLDFDTNIAVAQLKEAFEYLTDKADPSAQSLFVNVGDLIHADGSKNTTFSGTQVDVDTRHEKTLRAAAEAMVYGINLQLKKHKRVVVVMARGNHDKDTSVAVQLMLEFYYKNEPRVHVLRTQGHVHYVEWEKNLIGIHHGDKMKPEKLATVMPRDQPEAWARTNYRLWATGHYHKEQVKVFDGVRHKVFGALPPPDSWHASMGFAGDGEMEMLVFKNTGGVQFSAVFSAPQPRLEPDVRI